MKPILIASICLSLSGVLNLAGQRPDSDPLAEVILRIDTMEYSRATSTITIGNEKKIAFEYNDPDEVCELILNFSKDIPGPLPTLVPSGDFSIIDSLAYFHNGQYKAKIRFTDLTRSEFLSVRLRFNSSVDSGSLTEIKLFPYTRTSVYFYPPADELYIGEEKIFELVSDNYENVKPIPEWQNYNGIDYRVSSRLGQLRLHILPKGLGEKNLRFQLTTYRPFLDSTGNVSYKLPAVEHTFMVRQSRIRFANIDKNEIILNDTTRTTGILIQMDNIPGMEMQKTYRIENQEEPGGGLIAELFTKNPLTNNRILCILRVYNYHRESDGYLYLKDNDIPRYLTNFSIIPATDIKKINMLHEGQDWTTSLSAGPGETVDIMIEGNSLNKGNFRFEDVEDLSPDTSLRNDRFIRMKVKIPLSVNKRNLVLFHNGNPTGYSISVKEFQEPRDLDYVTLNYGYGDKTLTELRGLLMSPKTIGDIVIDFNRNRIDSQEKIYGKQYLKIGIKITGKNGELIEMRDIDNIVIVPGEKSPRSSFYDRRDETTTALSLNKFLRKKTYELEDWAKIELVLENSWEKYTATPFRKEIEIYIQKQYKFDIDVSFPAGLLINTFDKSASGSQYQNFGGISMSMMAQFSFYDQERPGKYKPYKIGAGFLALNAFNLSSDPAVSRDMGIVVIGSLYPTRKDVKLTFPLHMGGGYKLNEGKWFILIGPGISVRL